MECAPADMITFGKNFEIKVKIFQFSLFMYVVVENVNYNSLFTGANHVKIPHMHKKCEM